MLKLALLVSCGCVLIDTNIVSTVSVVPVPKQIVGRWLAEDINGGGVIDDLQTTLEINDDGTYAGFAGCNSYTGIFTIENGEVVFGPAGTTRKLCPPALMNQETKFLDVLKAGLSFRIDDHAKLVLKRNNAQAASSLTLVKID